MVTSEGRLINEKIRTTAQSGGTGKIAKNTEGLDENIF
jgi:hypothetical protein